MKDLTPIQKRLIKDNLAEVHKTRWIARYAALDRLLQAEEERPNPDQRQIDTLKATLDEHEKNRFRPEVTAAELLGPETPATDQDPVSEFMEKNRGRLSGIPEIET